MRLPGAQFEGLLMVCKLLYKPARFYRLVYRRRAKNGGTLPPASDRPHHHDDVIEGTVNGEQEDRLLLATEESRQRYGMGCRHND